MSEFPFLPDAQEISPAGYLRDIRLDVKTTQSATPELNEDGSVAGPDEPFTIIESRDDHSFSDYTKLYDSVQALILRVDTIGQHTQWLVTQLQGLLGAAQANPMMRGVFRKMNGGG